MSVATRVAAVLDGIVRRIDCHEPGFEAEPMDPRHCRTPRIVTAISDYEEVYGDDPKDVAAAVDAWKEKNK